MSWGIDHEVAGVGSIDGIFTTPKGHTGVTFVAAAGDHGVPSYPATSPNVLAVGGTTLSMFTNQYYGETVWNAGYDKSNVYWSTGGGYSKYEGKPTYQAGAERTGYRGAVDVSLNAAQNLLIYTSAIGWGYYGGGTSAATPEMAAIVAVANEGRALAGRTSFYGVNSALYALPSSDFHDVTAGHNGYYSAGAGWDPVTGRGSPVADRLIRDLVNSGSWYTPQYGVSNFVGVGTLRAHSSTYFRSSVAVDASLSVAAADIAATGTRFAPPVALARSAAGRRSTKLPDLVASRTAGKSMPDRTASELSVSGIDAVLGRWTVRASLALSCTTDNA
jgi:subtilase family serine protease